MAARRCSLCGINYPAAVTKCPVHEVEAVYYQNLEPEELWEWKAEALRTRIKRGHMPTAVPPIVSVPITEDEGGRFWISSYDLIGAGLHDRLKPDDVLEIPSGLGEKPGEPCHCLWEVMGYRDSTRSYWVRPLLVPDTLHG